MHNRLWNCHNPHQGTDIKVLCVCSAGLLRSPTLARWLVRNFKNVNPRAVGCEAGHALIPLDQVHLEWADVILCADDWNLNSVYNELNSLEMKKEIHCLNIPDAYAFGDYRLESIIKSKFEMLLSELEFSEECSALTKLV